MERINVLGYTKHNREEEIQEILESDQDWVFVQTPSFVGKKTPEAYDHVTEM